MGRASRLGGEMVGRAGGGISVIKEQTKTEKNRRNSVEIGRSPEPSADGDSGGKALIVPRGRERSPGQGETLEPLFCSEEDTVPCPGRQ